MTAACLVACIKQISFASCHFFYLVVSSNSERAQCLCISWHSEMIRSSDQIHRERGGICAIVSFSDAGWSSLAARRAHNPKVTGSNPVPATKHQRPERS